MHTLQQLEQNHSIQVLTQPQNQLCVQISPGMWTVEAPECHMEKRDSHMLGRWADKGWDTPPLSVFYLGTG